MAIDFWQVQRRARRQTAIYLTCFVLLTLLATVILELALRQIARDQYCPPLPLAGMGFFTITIGVALFQYSQFCSSGGKYVAESMGARQVDRDTNDPKERQLLNIVEEIAIAASLPVPPVFIIPAEQINAFAAGLNTNDAVIAITKGALQKLSRDEIQGVIAHELGHVSNGDMKIGLRLAAMLMGFYFVLYIALRILQFSGRGNSKKGNQAALIALVFLAVGAFTWLFGSILKAAVSRQREYLADASSVQFARNPDGLINALKKIGEENIKDMPKTGMAYSHLYLDDRGGISWLFATHPPLEKRIEKLEGKK